MGLFRRRTGLEDALRAHLERLGVSSFWLGSALDAIHCCEQGDIFQPVFSVAGPAPARHVVALMKLEPFVRGEIDWSISPSESPFWVGSLGDPQDDVFDAAASRFLGLYWSDRNPSVRTDLGIALREMDAPQSLSPLASAGYVWRAAESAIRTTNLDMRAALEKEAAAVVASFPKGESPERILGWAAAECVNRDLLFGSASPGGWASGGEFLRRGFRFVEERVFAEDLALPLEDRWYAFTFGVALYDVDAVLATLPPREAGRPVRKSRSPQAVS